MNIRRLYGPHGLFYGGSFESSCHSRFRWLMRFNAATSLPSSCEGCQLVSSHSPFHSASRHLPQRLPFFKRVTCKASARAIALQGQVHSSRRNSFRINAFSAGETILRKYLEPRLSTEGLPAVTASICFAVPYVRATHRPKRWIQPPQQKRFITLCAAANTVPPNIGPINPLESTLPVFKIEQILPAAHC